MKFAKVILFVTISLSMTIGTCVANPQVSEIAIVDLKQIAVESKAGKSIEEQIITINKSSQKDLLELEAQIKSMDSAKKTDAERRKIEDLQIMIYDILRSKKYAIAEAYRIAVTELERKIKDVLIKMAQEKGIKIIITSDAIIYVDKSINNLNQEAINRIDKECPYIKVGLKI